MLLLQLLRLLEAAGDGEAGDEHGLGVPDPAHDLTHRVITSHPLLRDTDLRGVRLEGGELHALLQLDPPDGGVVLHVHCPLLHSVNSVVVSPRQDLTNIHALVSVLLIR